MKAIALHTTAAIVLTFGVAACSSQQEAPAPTPAPVEEAAPAPVAAPPPAPAPTPTPTPTPTTAPQLGEPEFANFLDAPQTRGTWFYSARANQTRAVFGPNPSDVSFMMVCNAADGAITLIRADSAELQRTARIRTETRRRSLTMTTPRAGSGIISAELGARDPLLDAMAITKGRFAVETAGLPTLYLPAWVEVTRVIEDCR
jgi:hypothetical protein